VSLPSALGAMLTGGSSTRMGREKPGIELQGRTLAQRAGHTLAQFAVEVVQVGGEPLPDLQRRYIPDLRSGCGPAAGIEAALAAADIPVVVLAVDLPMVPASLLLEALRAIDTGAVICAPRLEGRWHPLCAAYSQAALAPLQSRLDAGKFKMQQFLDELATPLENDALRTLGDPEEMLLNVNTPADLELARDLL